MSDIDINYLITYADIIGNWLTLKILIYIAKQKEPVHVDSLRRITDLVELSYYKEKLEILKGHLLINKHNMITLKGKRFLKLMNNLIVLE